MNKNTKSEATDILHLSKHREVKNHSLSHKVSYFIKKTFSNLSLLLFKEKDHLCFENSPIAKSSYENQVYYIFFLIAIIAKYSQLKGYLSKIEESTFLNEIKKRGYDFVDIKGFFGLALEENNEYSFYIRKMKLIYPGNYLLFKEVIDIILTISSSDKPISTTEMDRIKDIAKIFNLSSYQFTRIFNNKFEPEKFNDPFSYIGASRNITRIELSKLYRDLAKKHHPDNYSSDSIDPEFKKIMQQRFYTINNAVEMIKKEKNIK